MTRTPLSLAAAVLLLGACATYEPATISAPLPVEQGDGVGYAEKQVGPDLYEVFYYGPYSRAPVFGRRSDLARESAKEFAYDMALWRTAEISNKDGEGAFQVVESETEVEVDTSRIPRLHLGVGFGHGFHHSHFLYGDHYRLFGPFGRRGSGLYSPSHFERAYVQADTKLVAKLVPKDTPGAFTAERVFQGVSEKYRIGGAGGPDAALTPSPDSEWRDPDQSEPAN